MARSSGIMGLLVPCFVCASASAEPPQAVQPGHLAPVAPAMAADVAAAPLATSAPRLSSQSEPVLFVSEGLDGVLSVPDLRARLSAALGRDLVSLVDARAHRAQAIIWIGVGAHDLVLRVSPPERSEAWRQLPRDGLGADPVATLMNAVLEMFWAETYARLDSREIQDPFCPPGLICVDAQRGMTWPPVPEAEVLDPWDSSYRTFYGWDPSAYASQEEKRDLTRARAAPSEQWSRAAVPGPRRQLYALNFLGGGGVHQAGAFFRYEVDALCRFPSFDFGLAFVGARGQPEPAHKARRAVAALLERRFLADAFELDLGASFGAFFATFFDHDVAVRPYLRGAVTFALPIGRVFDLLVQSEIATTFAEVHETGAVEYALSLGLRHRM